MNDLLNETDFDLDLEELVSAEDFFIYFHIDFKSNVVHVNRLHILQRFHDYLAKEDLTQLDDNSKFICYKTKLQKAYDDFVCSDSITEKVFNVFKVKDPNAVHVRLVDIEM